jgi:hypothetical protein
MDNLYKTIRRIHLNSAFITSVFLLMYFISGLFLMMGSVFPRALKQTVSEQAALSAGKSESENIAEICNRYHIYGDETVKIIPGNKKSYSYFRPAYRAEILLDETLPAARVKISEGTIWSVMNDFHRLRGYTGNWAHRLWSLFYDLSCISLIVMALTGVYLWWKMERKKRLGIVFLLVSTGLTLFTVMYLATVC